jgi:O-antigen/teichoic acid export membrane protein
MRKKLVINSLSGVAQFIVSTLLIFITVPIFIKKMGIETYGIYSLILIINNLNNFLGFGLGSGLIKFLSEQGKSNESNIDIFAVSIFLLVIMIPFTILGLFFNDFVIKAILHVPLKYCTADIYSFYNFLVIANLFQFIAQVPVSILDSLQKIYLTSLFQTVYQLLYWVGSLIVLFTCGTLSMIGIGILLSTIIWFVLLLYSSFKHWGIIYPACLTFEKIFKSLRKQVGYNIKLYFSSLVNFFYEPLTKILIASFMGATQVGYYDVILKFRNQLWNLLTKFLYPLVPFLSKLNDKTSLRKLVHDIEQKLSYVSIISIVLIIGIIPDFLKLWLKMEPGVVPTGMTIILSANLVALILVPMYQYLMLKGHPGKTVVIQLANVISNLLLFLLFYKSYGFIAVIIGNVGANIISTLLGLYYQWKYLNSLIFDSFKQVFKVLIFFIVLLIANEIFSIVLVGSYLKIIILPVIIIIISIYMSRITKLLTNDDIIRYAGNNIKVQKLLQTIFVPVYKS